MYTDLFVLDGILETKEEINQAIREQTGDNDDFSMGKNGRAGRNTVTVKPLFWQT